MEDFVPLILLAITGAIAGFINVMAGGGSLLTMPALKLLLGLDGPEVNGSNRIAILGGSISAVIHFFKKGYSDFKLSLSLALCAAPGAILGAYAGTLLRGVWFNRVLAVVMIMVLILMSRKRQTAQTTDSDSHAPRAQHPTLGYLLMVGVGFYGGFIQAGVGFLLMAVLHKVMGLDLVRVNMHKMFITMVFTTVALTVFALRGHVVWLAGLCLAVGNSSGSWIGTHFAIQKGEKIIRIVFQIAIVALACRLLLL